MSAVPKYKSGVIISLWKQGFDTADIALRVGLTEAYVYNTLSRWRP